MFQKGLFLVGVVVGLGAVGCARAEESNRAPTRQRQKLPSGLTPLHRALMFVESKDNPWAIGDKHLAQKAYGILQIRQPAVDDLNRAYAKEIQKRWGKRTLRAEDFLGNPVLSVWAFERYTALYATPKLLGRAPTDQDRARIWNGGPSGWKRRSTLKYWQKVQAGLPR